MNAELILPNPPTANRRLIPTKAGRWVTAPAMRRGKAEVAEMIPPPPEGWNPDDGASVEIVVRWPDKRRRDLSNIIKPIEDAIDDAGYVRDDSLIYEMRVVRYDSFGLRPPMPDESVMRPGFSFVVIRDTPF